MKFEKFGITGRIVSFSLLETIMESIGLVRGGQWDWERVTYDYKYENTDNGDIYYLRVQGIAIQGEVESPNAQIKLGDPFLGRHYYPHGVEYDEDFPKHVVKKSKDKLHQLKELLQDSE